MISDFSVAHQVWISGLLLLGDVLATIAVAYGIILETPEDPDARQRRAIKFVIIGVIFETVFGVGLFAFDALVSQAQQTTIGLQTEYLAGRQMTPLEREAISSLKGKIPVLLIVADKQCGECFNFAAQIDVAFDTPSAHGYIRFFEFEGIGSGCVWEPPEDKDIVFEAVQRGGFEMHKCPYPAAALFHFPLGVPIISVQQQPPFDVWLKRRSEAQGAPLDSANAP